MYLSRRQFLAASAATFAGSSFVWGPLAGLARTGAIAEALTLDGCDVPGAYGPLVPAIDQTTGVALLDAPAGFTVRSLGWTGDLMDNGLVTPPRHDGMGAFVGADGSVVVIRNHENWVGSPFGGPVYDPAVGGGATALRLDPSTMEVRGQVGVLGGTLINCSGGPTPWGSWFSCEETTMGPGDPNPFGEPFAKRHGYVFEVPAEGVASAQPLVDMGRFRHEATMTDPLTMVTYLTEDSGEAGFYMFLPDDRREYQSGGRLYMLAVRGQPGFDFSGGVDPTLFPLEVEWVRIADPDPDIEAGAATCQQQGRERGGATFRRLEGCWWGGDVGYFASTTGGGAGQGQIFGYHPNRYTPFRGELHLLIESSGAAVMNHPDNLVGSPNGSLIAFEDGEVPQHVVGVTPGGDVFPLLTNRCVLNGERNGIVGDFTFSESTGGCFTPDGSTLLFNMQTPGITFAVTGDWSRGCL